MKKMPLFFLLAIIVTNPLVFSQVVELELEIRTGIIFELGREREKHQLPLMALFQPKGIEPSSKRQIPSFFSKKSSHKCFQRTYRISSSIIGGKEECGVNYFMILCVTTPMV